jgi:hypothetical protein
MYYGFSTTQRHRHPRFKYSKLMFIHHVLPGNSAESSELNLIPLIGGVRDEIVVER